MHVAVLGGTGDIGEGLAVRIARDTDHDVLVGSRDQDRAATAAEEYETVLDQHGVDVTIEGLANPEAASEGDVVVLAVPAYYLVDTIESVEGELGDAILVSPAVGMKRDEGGMSYNPPSAGSVTELAVKAAPDETPVVGAFHNLAAGALADPTVDLDWDVVVVGDDDAAKSTVTSLVEAIEGLRPLDAGGVSNAAEVESLTPLLINLATNNEGMHDLGITFQ